LPERADSLAALEESLAAVVAHRRGRTVLVRGGGNVAWDLKRVRRHWDHGDMGQGSRAQGVELIPLPAIQKRILVVRERHVMLDQDLAALYGVETRALVQ